MIAAAIKWEKPIIGGSSKNDAARGAQWRLVMAYGGTEIIVKTLLCKTDTRQGLGPTEFALFETKSVPPAHSRPAAPAKNRDLDEWILRPPVGSTSAISSFLTLDGGDANIIHKWLVTRAELASWTDALQLTKALRNVTAHGVLTPSRANKWGMTTVFEVLTLDLGRLVTAALQKLT